MYVQSVCVCQGDQIKKMKIRDKRWCEEATKWGEGVFPPPTVRTFWIIEY